MATAAWGAEVIVVGSEILEGRLREANLVVIAEAMRAAGVAVDRAVILPDDEPAITAAVRAALEAPRPRLVVIAGGTGGTWDDVTYAAVAAALGRRRSPVASIAERLAAIIAWTRATGYDLEQEAVDSMMNIALVPDGALTEVVDDWLVAVTLQVDGGVSSPHGASIVLPGPPEHCARLVDEVLTGRILAGHESSDITVEVEHHYPETLLTGAVLRVRSAHPHVTIGSYPGDTTVLRIVGPPAEARVAAAEIQAAITVLDSHPAAARLRSAWGTQQNWTTPR